MQERNDVHVVECEAEDLVRYLEDDDRLAGSLGDVLEDYRIEFRYNTAVEGNHDADFQPVLNASGIKRLVEMAPVRWTDTDNDETLVLLLDEADRSNPTYNALKDAFGAHNRDSVDTGKDPRRLWREFTEE
jgi:hypothetical protein